MTTPPRPELSEKDFIQEGYKKNPLPLWVWFFLLTILAALFWGGSNWYGGKINSVLNSSPFLQVTNREMSLFLWQNPEFMRINAKEKNGYLPAFRYQDKVTMDLSNTEDYVIAPPELLFRYHTWKRLVSSEFAQRPIPPQEFQNFLSYAEEWQPSYWPGAPTEYVDMVKTLPSSKLEDLSSLSLQALPMPVRMAFQGWTNYFLDREAINEVQPSQKQMADFLKSFPHYARHYWRNIVMDNTPHYLKSLTDDPIPADELSSFLRVAFYNYLEASKKVEG